MLLRAAFRSSRRTIGVAARSRMGPDRPRLPYSVRSQKQDGQRTPRPNVDHKASYPPIAQADRRPVDNSRGYTRVPMAFAPRSSATIEVRWPTSMTSDSPPRFAHDSEAELARILDLLRCRVAIRTRRLPHLLERRRRGHRVVRARLLPAGDRPLRRAHDAEAVAGAQEEPQAALDAAALSRRSG